VSNNFLATIKFNGQMPVYSNPTFGLQVNKTSGKDKYVIIPFSVISCHTFFSFFGGEGDYTLAYV
jgi:hypothetical protein